MMDYKVMSRNVCMNYCTQNHKNTSVIISIRSSWDNEFPILPCNSKNNVKAVLYLSFDDVEKDKEPKYCMSEEDGKKVSEFVNKWYDKVDRIIVHCDGGISRSAGVCAGIMKVKEGDDMPIFKNKSKHPNMTCYLHTLKGFNYI